MYEYTMTVDRWIDGDTLSAKVDLGFYISLEARFRIKFLDTPERGQLNFKEATDCANKLYPPGTKIVVKTEKLSGFANDKYGRWLIELPELVKTLTEQNLLKKPLDIIQNL